MDIIPSNQLQIPNDEENQTGNLEVGDNCKSEDIAFQYPAQARLLQEGFGLSSPKLKAKRRKKDMLEVHGGRIIRSTGRKDRHSKVCTARGTRDRRLRLSPKTAILFYDVQDRLGYDRPSKAIDWLMKEAKAAIDALEEPPPAATNVAEIHGFPNSKNQQMLKTGSGIIQNVKHLDDDYPISSFGFFTEAAGPPPQPPSSTEFRAYPNDDFNSLISRSKELCFSEPLATPSEVFDTNLEIARLQRIYSWNYSSVSSPPPPLFPVPADIGHSHIFSGREPLQSSYSRISNYPPQLPGVGFSIEEMLNFTGAAAFKEGEMENTPVSSKSSSTASFLHYEQ